VRPPLPRRSSTSCAHDSGNPRRHGKPATSHTISSSDWTETFGWRTTPSSSPTTTLPTWNTFANTTSTFPRSYAPNMLTLVSHGSTTSSSTSASDSSPASICTPSLRVKKTGRKRSLLPVGVVFYQPAPELSAWYKTAKALKKRGGPPTQRPRKPAPNPQYPTKDHLALRLLASFKAQHGAVRIHAVMADALYGTATFVDGASALFNGVQVISQIRRNQNIRVGKRHQHVADYPYNAI